MRRFFVAVAILTACSGSSSHTALSSADAGTGQEDAGHAGSQGSGSAHHEDGGRGGMSSSGTGEGGIVGDDAGDPNQEGGTAPTHPDATVPSDAGAMSTPGNTNGSCTSMSIPAETKLVDTSSPTTVVGTGTAASCTFTALSAAVTKGGTVTFDCGPGAVTIPVTATLTPPTSNEYAHQAPLTVVIDGGGKVTLDGQGSVRIMSWVHTGSWRVNQDTLTLQRLTFVNGKATPTEAVPACPPANGIANTACSTGYDDGQGGALNMRDGNLRVIECTFENNEAAMLGPDTGGGAIYLQATASPSYIMQSSFLNNTASNAGGIGMLWAGAYVLNSLFEGNKAVGTGANSNSASECTCSNMGNANQTGSGGNGGALYKDGGDGVNLTVCGTEIKGNTSNEFGPAIFLTADGSSAELVIDDCDITENTGNAVWHWCLGVSTDNPTTTTGGSPAPVKTTFCDATGANCTMSCGS